MTMKQYLISKGLYQDYLNKKRESDKEYWKSYHKEYYLKTMKINTYDYPKINHRLSEYRRIVFDFIDYPELCIGFKGFN